MRRLTFLLILIMPLLFSCRGHHRSPLDEYQWEEIPGRGEFYCSEWVEPQPIYRAKAPRSWKRMPNPAPESTLDTKQAICEFLYGEGEEAVRITIHNFPSDSLQERIPPAAQVMRWEKQFDQIRPAQKVVQPFARAGFSGLYFEATGMQGEKPITVLAWSLQLGSEHYRSLLPRTDPLSRQKRADCTIKAVGPENLIRIVEEQIHAFAASFELIDPLTTAT